MAREERIFYVTPGYRLVALNAKTGARIADLRHRRHGGSEEDDDQIIDPVTGEVGLHAAPVVANDTIIVGAAHRSGGVPRSKTNVKGYVRAFDVRTGKRLWIFHTIPKPGEFGYNTWEKDSADYTGNTGVWGQISVDEQLGMAYLPVELPTGDYYGGHRPGNGLFGESIVAVDLKTGVRKWHYQLVHHGIWDMDIPCAPMLVDLTVNGRAVKALAQPTKQAFLYMFDRITGQPIFPIEERPVEQSTVPGRKDQRDAAVPHQAAGLRSPRLFDGRPDRLHAGVERASARDRLALSRSDPIFTPPVLSKAGGPLGTLAFATAARWNQLGGRIGRSGNRHRLRAFAKIADQSGAGAVRSQDQRFPLRAGHRDRRARGLRPAPAPTAGADPAGAEAAAATVRLSVQDLPLFKPPYGQISAIDLNKGEILWQSRARRNSGCHSQSSGAQGPDHSAHRPRRHRRASS